MQCQFRDDHIVLDIAVTAFVNLMAVPNVPKVLLDSVLHMAVEDVVLFQDAIREPEISSSVLHMAVENAVVKMDAQSLQSADQIYAQVMVVEGDAQLMVV